MTNNKSNFKDVLLPKGFDLLRVFILAFFATQIRRLWNKDPTSSIIWFLILLALFYIMPPVVLLVRYYIERKNLSNIDDNVTPAIRKRAISYIISKHFIEGKVVTYEDLFNELGLGKRLFNMVIKKLTFDGIIEDTKPKRKRKWEKIRKLISLN